MVGADLAGWNRPVFGVAPTAKAARVQVAACLTEADACPIAMLAPATFFVNALSGLERIR